MKVRHKSVLTVFLLALALAATTFAQGPLRKKVNLSINVPYTVKMGAYLLPAGDYTLFQIMENDLNLFALYQGDMTHAPVAMIRTIRIDYAAAGYPQKTKLMIEMDEMSRDNHPVLQGWTIPGMDGWEIIGVVEKKPGTLARLR